MDIIFPERISDSCLKTWSMCELRWFREYCQCLTRDIYNIDLSAGAAFAKGIELTRKAYYLEGKGEEEAVETGRIEILTNMKEEEKVNNPVDFLSSSKEELKNPVRMSNALVTYFNEFPLEDEGAAIPYETAGQKGVEHTFVITLPIKHPITGKALLLKGRLDMLCKDQFDRLLMIDEKTCKVFSNKEQELLSTSGQFIGYAYQARELGYTINQAAIRKVAIQLSGIKVKEFLIPITEYAIDLWYESMLTKVQAMVDKFEKVMEDRQRFKKYFTPDFQLGCTSFYKPCPFQVGCLEQSGEGELQIKFQQIFKTSRMKEGILLENFEYGKY